MFPYGGFYGGFWGPAIIVIGRRSPSPEPVRRRRSPSPEPLPAPPSRDEQIAEFKRAVREGNLSHVNEVLSERPSWLAGVLDENNPAEGTLLHIAASNGHGSIIEALVTKGRMNVNTSHRGKTPLLVGCGLNNSGVIRALVNVGADVNVAGPRGVRPVHELAVHGNSRDLHMLVSKGADINVQCAQGKTPFVMACEADKIGCARRMLALTQLDKGAKNRKGETILHTVVRTGNPGLVKAALEAGVNKYQKDNTGAKPAHLADELGHTAIGEMLKDLAPAESIKGAVKGAVAAAEILTKVVKPVLVQMRVGGDLDAARTAAEEHLKGVVEKLKREFSKDFRKESVEQLSNLFTQGVGKQLKRFKKALEGEKARRYEDLFASYIGAHNSSVSGPSPS